MGRCAPIWYKPELNQTTCPYGRELLGDITVPNVWYDGYPGLSQFSVVVFVGYSLIPWMTVIWATVLFFRAALVRSSCTRFWVPGQPLKASEGWRLRHMQESVKFFGFSLMALLTKWVMAFPLEQLHRGNSDQRWVFLGSQRPPQSCVTTCSMPNGQSLWAYGLLAHFFMELCFRLNLPHLWDKGTYTKPMSTLLGLHPIRTRTFLLHTIAIFLLFVPVPMSRVMLNDASPEQVIFGAAAGILLAILYHCLYLFLFKHENPLPTSRAVKLRKGLVYIAMWLEALCCCACLLLRRRPLGEPLIDAAMQMETRGQISADSRALDVQAAPVADEAGAGASAPVLLPDVDPEFVEQDASLLVDEAAQDEGGHSAAGQLPERHRCRWLRPFEFLTVSSAAEVARMSGRAVAAERQAATAMAATEAAQQREREATAAASEAQRRSRVATAAAEEAEQRSRESQATAKASESYKEFAEKSAMEAREARAKALKECDAARKLQREEREKSEQQMNLIVCKASQVTACLKQLQDAVTSGELQLLDTAVLEAHEQLQKLSEKHNGEEPDILPQLNEIVERKLEECKLVKSEWMRSLDNLKSRLKRVAATGAENPRRLTSDAESVFRCMMDAIRTGMNLPKSDEQLVRDAEKVLMKWPSVYTLSEKQRELIMKIIGKVMWAGEREKYGDITFTELSFCVQTIQKSDSPSFINEGLKLVGGKDPKDFQAALEHLNTLVFLLDSMDKEDISLAKRWFRQLNADQAKFLKDVIETLCEDGEAKPGQYVESEAFLQPSDLTEARNNPEKILHSIAERGSDNKLLHTFRNIFLRLAREQYEQFGVLMAPHHTQTIALLIFKEFLEQLGAPVLEGKKALIARVATGEGKSMLIAAQAAYIALSRTQGGVGKKVHVVGTDERLVARDFKDFDRALFQAMGIKAMCLCGDSKESEEETWRDVWKYDVVYCLPHHIALLYTNEVTSGGRLDRFNDCVLLVDEVDALVIDKSPTDVIIDNHKVLSEYAMEIGVSLHLHGRVRKDLVPERGSQDYKEKQRVCKMVQQKWKQAVEISRDPTETDFLRSTDVNDAGWVAKDPKSGLPDKSKQSTQLEILRFSHRLRSAEPDVVKRNFPMKWFEPLFVMSKPLVFGRYSCILGFSGTLGDDEEKGFLEAAYKCVFLDVPEFLRTCRGDLWHSAEWTTPDLQRPASVKKEDFPQEAVVVFSDQAGQLQRVRDLAFRARRHVPVLIIAGSTDQAHSVVQELREEAQRCLGDDEDVMRDLSHAQWQRSKMDYKDNLFLATQRVGPSATDHWRITVTDASGGRGTDYKMNDAEADRLGGLLLIVMKVPLSSREWVQYQGRTARQDRRGQITAVLCAQDYMAQAEGIERALPHEAYDAGCDGWVAPDAEAAVQRIMAFGTQESRRALQATRNELVAGWRAHELCEELACRASGGLPTEQEDFLRWLKRYRTADLEQHAGEARRLFLGGAGVPACALPPEYLRDYEADVKEDQGRGVVFALDVSYSMDKEVPEKVATRLEICKERAELLLTEHVGDRDVISLLLFSDILQWKLDPVPKGTGQDALRRQLQQAQTNGGTAMRDAIVEGVAKLAAISEENQWHASRSVLIVLTDGADGHSNIGVEGLAENLANFDGMLLLITVGLTDAEMDGFNADFARWEAVCGGDARHFRADWADVDEAFARVREALDEEVVGLDRAAP